MAELTPDDPQYYVRDPKTGLSQAQIDANKAVAEAASLAGYSVLKGATGTDATASRVVTPYTGGNTYMGKTYATPAGAYAAAVRAQESAGAPSAAPAGTHWTLQGTQWKLYDAYGRPVDPKNPVLLAPPGTITTTSTNTSTSTSTNNTSTNNTSNKTYTSSDGKSFTSYDAYIAYQATLDKAKADRQSAYDLLYSQFAQYGLEGLVTPLKGLIESGISPSEFTLRLRETDAYKKRFAANQARIQKGLRALSEAEYIQLEDQYQNVMRNYGMPKEYYARGDMGVQPGFEKFIVGDVSAAELEDRIQTAQNRVINAAPEVANTLRQFYPDITNGDILAYALDPEKALTTIKRKIGAAEIGAGAAMAGLSTGLSRAEELQKYGVTGEAARAGYQAIGSMLPRATQLGDIYAKSGLGPYDQMTAEAEIFGTPGATEAQRKRLKLTQLEQAQFGGSSGATGGALGRERAGQF